MAYHGTQEIHTERLLLRPFRLSDAQAMNEGWCNDEAVIRFLGFPPHGAVENTRALLTQWIAGYASPKTYKWCVVLKDADLPIGSLDAFLDKKQPGICELGYALAPAHQKKGYMTEAVHAVLSYLFTSEGMALVSAQYNHLNTASGAVMERVGMRKDAVLRKRRVDGLTGQWCDLVVYSITAEEFQGA